jgi:dTDP-4-dehydrorhamnose 3,5-epimerase
MRFIETPLSGAFVIDIEPIEDERGFFARAWCEDEFRARGLDTHLAQCNLSYNRKRGTLRGMHFQLPPHAETKMVRCTRGSIHDVIVDLRAGSPTRGGWFGADLSAENRRAIYVPQEFAHGFVTLEDDSEVFYQMSRAHVIDAGRGVRWSDPAIAIQWPVVPAIISERDANWPLLGRFVFEGER